MYFLPNHTSYIHIFHLNKLINLFVEYDGDEPDHKRKKNEHSFQNVNETAVVYNKTKKSAKHKHERSTGGLIFGHDKGNTTDRRAKESSSVHVQTGHLAYETTKSCTAVETVQVFNSAKPCHAVDSNGPSSSKKEMHILYKRECLEESPNKKNDDNQSRDASQLEGVHAESKRAEYVYRLLGFKETYHIGLAPKSFHSKTTLMEHVENGSKGVISRFISCCKTLHGLQKLASITNESVRCRGVVRINIAKLNPKEVKVIDLTDVSVREKHIARDSIAWEYANRFEEVILDPKTRVPAECVQKIGTVRCRSFTKFNNVTL